MSAQNSEAEASQSTSLLYLSCDLVGSTRHKQAKNEYWPKTFLSFYREFPQALAGEIKAADSALEFKLWKAVGDELIFTCVVRHEAHVIAAIRIWIAAMTEYERGTLADEGMSTKGGAFIATFPGPDSQVSIPLDPTNETSDKGVVELNDEALANYDPAVYLYDYLGPSIDTGFRVIGECNPRYFTLSVEAAWALCRGASYEGLPDLPDLRVLAPKELKGVWGGRPYPIIVIDRHFEDGVNQAIESLNGGKQSFHDIEVLCSSCSSSAGWPSAIYLPDSDFPQFRVEPADSLGMLRTNAMEGSETIPAPSEDRKESKKASSGSLLSKYKPPLA